MQESVEVTLDSIESRQLKKIFPHTNLEAVVGMTLTFQTLMSSARCDDAEQLRKLLPFTKSTAFDASDDSANTLLLEAIAHSSVQAALVILDFCNVGHVNIPSGPDYYKNTPLIFSSAKGWSHVDDRRKMAYYADNASNMDPELNQGVIFTALINKGADLNAQDAFGRTALHFACLHRNEEAIQMLLKAKARVNIPDNEGNFPVDYLFLDATKLKKILKVSTCGFRTIDERFFEPDFDLRPILASLFPQENAEEALCKYQFLKAVMVGDLEAVKVYMLANKDNADALNIVDQSGSTALINAICSDQLEVVKALRSNDLVDIYRINHYGKSASNYVHLKKSHDREQFLAALSIPLQSGIQPSQKVEAISAPTIVMPLARKYTTWFKSILQNQKPVLDVSEQKHAMS